MSMTPILNCDANSIKISAQAREQILPSKNDPLIDFKNIDWHSVLACSDTRFRALQASIVHINST
jgi:hypothetical protein